MSDAPDKCLNCGHLWQYHGGSGTNECSNLGGASPAVAACDCKAQNPRDCSHGHRWGKCDTCDLIEAERDLAAARAEIDRLQADREEIAQAYAKEMETNSRLESELDSCREANESVAVCSLHTTAITNPSDIHNGCYVCECTSAWAEIERLRARSLRNRELYESTRDARRVERALRHKDTNGVYPSDDPSNPWVHMVGRTLGIRLDEWERLTDQPDIDAE